MREIKFRLLKTKPLPIGGMEIVGYEKWYPGHFIEAKPC
jgi:hypothetical protein